MLTLYYEYLYFYINLIKIQSISFFRKKQELYFYGWIEYIANKNEGGHLCCTYTSNERAARPHACMRACVLLIQKLSESSPFLSSNLEFWTLFFCHSILQPSRSDSSDNEDTVPTRVPERYDQQTENK